MDERLAVIEKLINTDHDFTVKEEVVIDPDTAKYAANAAESNDRWRRRIKYDFLVLKSDKVKGKGARDRLTRRYHSFAKRMKQTDSDELLEMYLTSFTASFDPHTTYMSPNSLEIHDPDESPVGGHRCGTPVVRRLYDLSRRSSPAAPPIRTVA